jgi:hypothetical protein
VPTALPQKVVPEAVDKDYHRAPSRWQVDQIEQTCLAILVTLVVTTGGALLLRDAQGPEYRWQDAGQPRRVIGRHQGLVKPEV